MDRLANSDKDQSAGEVPVRDSEASVSAAIGHLSMKSIDQTTINRQKGRNHTQTQHTIQRINQRCHEITKTTNKRRSHKDNAGREKENSIHTERAKGRIKRA